MDQVLESDLSDRARRHLAGTPDERSDAIRQLSGLIATAHAELLDVVAAADASCDWVADGSTHMASWLVAACGITTPHAREWVRVAGALQGLPTLRDVYADGGLSWDQLRPATILAGLDDDAIVAATAPGYSASQLSRLARKRRGRPDADARHARENRYVTLRPDHRRGGWNLAGFLASADGAMVDAALRTLAEGAGPDPETGTWDLLGRRLADALVDLAVGGERPGAGVGSRAVAAQVVIHADADRWDGDPDGSVTVGDMVLNPEGLLRSLCDAKVECALHDAQGRTVGIGRSRRTIDPWLARQVRRRDHSCRFPGCERPIRQIHHIHHWARGGSTNLDNLVGLCWHHHDLVHDGGWTIAGDPEAELEFVSPTGRRIGSRPHPLRPDVRYLLTGDESG